MLIASAVSDITGARKCNKIAQKYLQKNHFSIVQHPNSQYQPSDYPSEAHSKVIVETPQIFPFAIASGTFPKNKREKKRKRKEGGRYNILMRTRLLSPPFVSVKSAAYIYTSSEFWFKAQTSADSALSINSNQYSDGVITSSIFNIILTTCVASKICCCFPINVSNTFCSCIWLVPTSLQSMPQYGLFSCKGRAKIHSRG